MRRLFIGIPVSEDVKKNIQTLVSTLDETGADCNFVKEFHFTLKFLGDVEEEKIPEIIEKLNNISVNQFSVKLKGVGVFPNLKQIRVIWVGVEDAHLTQLMREVNTKLNYIRKNDHEETPHLTVARVKSAKNMEQLKKVLQTLKDKEFGEMVVDKMILYESELTPQGAVYKIVKEFTFQTNNL